MEKIKRTAKWHKKLTIKELRHVKETTDSTTLKQFKRNREFQKKENIKCWECFSIAHKLGLE